MILLCEGFLELFEMKKGFGFGVLLIAVGAALALLSFSSCNNSVSLAGSLSSLHEGSMKVMVTNRKQKESNYDQSGSMKNADSGNINLEDYRPVDPVPSSKAASSARPIEHGTPMIPHIPQPAPPSHPRHGGSP